MVYDGGRNEEERSALESRLDLRKAPRPIAFFIRAMQCTRDQMYYHPKNLLDSALRVCAIHAQSTKVSFVQKYWTCLTKYLYTLEPGNYRRGLRSSVKAQLLRKKLTSCWWSTFDGSPAYSGTV